MMRITLIMSIVLVVSISLVGCGSSGSKPSAHFTAFPIGGYAPSEVQFTDQSAGDINTWQWDFDNDGEVDSKLKNPRYTYTEPGTYTVSLTVKGPGGKDTKIREDYLTFTGTPCMADFSSESSNVGGSIEVRFSDRSTGDVTGWEWDFDSDGQVDSTEQNPIHTYSQYGSFSVTLTITTNSCTDSVTRENLIQHFAPPVAQFSASPTTGEVPVEVQFADISEGEIDTWKWDFNSDGVVDSKVQNPVYSYLEPGVYSVKLSVAGPGGSDTETKVAYLEFTSGPTPTPTPTPTPSYCRADFKASPTEGVGRTWVQFTDQSQGTIISRAWDFNGDGKTDSTAENPQYYYRTNGDYTVTLTVVGIGCTDTETKTNYIHITGCST